MIWQIQKPASHRFDMHCRRWRAGGSDASRVCSGVPGSSAFMSPLNAAKRYRGGIPVIFPSSPAKDRCRNMVCRPVRALLEPRPAGRQRAGCPGLAIPEQTRQVFPHFALARAIFRPELNTELVVGRASSEPTCALHTYLNVHVAEAALYGLGYRIDSVDNRRIKIVEEEFPHTPRRLTGLMSMSGLPCAAQSMIATQAGSLMVWNPWETAAQIADLKWILPAFCLHRSRHS